MSTPGKIPLKVPGGGTLLNPFVVEEEDENEEAVLLYGQIKSSDEEEEEAPLLPDYKPEVHPPGDFRGTTKLIYLSRNDIKALLSHIPPTKACLKDVVFNLYHSPITNIEEISKILAEWYLQKVENDIKDLRIASIPYQYTPLNTWIFNLIDLIPSCRTCNRIIENYMVNQVNIQCSIDTSDLDTLPDLISKKGYARKTGNGICAGDFISDLRRNAAYISSHPEMYVYKVRQVGYRRCSLVLYTPSEFQSRMKSMQLGVLRNGKKQKKITAWDVLIEGENLKFITFESITFYCQRPEVFSFFQRYEFDILPQCDEDALAMYTSHVYNIICSRSDEVYMYLMSWIAYIFQHPNGKTGTSIILIGAEGCGKNSFTNPICKLLGEYGDPNVLMENLTSEFNSLYLFKKLLVVNEKKDDRKNPTVKRKKPDMDVLKSIITEGTITIRRKYKDPITVENTTNLIFLSNHFDPIIIEEGDRRYLVIQCSSDVVNNIEYFAKFRKECDTDEFYQNLLTYFVSLDVSNWIPQKIPNTEAKDAIVSLNQNLFKIFIQDHLDQFRVGFEIVESFEVFKSWCRDNSYFGRGKSEYCHGILAFCQISKPWNGGTNRKQYYKIRKDAEHHFVFPKEEPKK